MVLKNKFITALLLLLVLANISTIAMYWLGRKNLLTPLPTVQKQFGPPSQFLIKELAFDSLQKIKYLGLVEVHQTQIKDLREKIMTSKNNFFDLIKQPVLNDTMAKNSVSQISLLTARQDMATLLHFRQVRNLCNPNQQQKFDSIIHQMLGIMAQQTPNMPPPNNNGEKPPPNGDRMPPPPDGQKTPPPDERRPPPDGQRRPPPSDGLPDGFQPPPKE